MCMYVCMYVPRNSFTCHWIRIASLVLCLDLQSLTTHVSEADQSCGVFWSLALAPQWYHILCFLIWECIFRFGSSLRLSGGDFLRHFDARKFHLPPLLSRNLSQNTSFSINFGYDCRSVLKHVLKSYDIFRDVHDSRKRVVGLIYTIQFVS